MKPNLLKVAGLLLMATATSATAQKLNITQSGDTTIVRVQQPTRYLLLPVEEEKDEAQVLLDTGAKTDTWMDVRLSRGKVDYYVPFALKGEGTSPSEAVVKILGLPSGSLALKDGMLKLSDNWDARNTDYYRPLYHHTPSYGWMNDANGMVYKDGEYHLYFQYNPYGSKWGNMHWGHAVSTDLNHWRELPPAIARDTMGHIFSGSSVVDKNNTAGYGKDAIIAIYTNNSVNHDEVQCLAYSTDNGRTFTKYEGNPVLRPFDGLKDFRDPKVFWYEPNKTWYMIVSADKEMRFYTSPNLKDWTYQSSFGKGWGAQPNQFECPDFFPLPTPDGKGQKYVMIVNINPGCLFGGSATEYFVGDFDGKEFKCDDDPHVAKWLDFGKDHYATVTFSNTGSRVVALPWMSNWQYANITPIKQYRGANGLARELSLYEKDGKYYVAANAVEETKAIRRDTKSLSVSSVKKECNLEQALAGTESAFELEMDVTPGKATETGFELYNAKGEKVKIYFDMKNSRLVMDRTESGLTDFGNYAVLHDIEKNYNEHHRDSAPSNIRNCVNYKNDFALGTWAPLNLCEGKTYHVDVFVDKCSVEIFVDGGRIAMTNLVFPTAPYESLKFTTDGGKAEYKNVKLHKIAL